MQSTLIAVYMNAWMQGSQKVIKEDRRRIAHRKGGLTSLKRERTCLSVDRTCVDCNAMKSKGRFHTNGEAHKTNVGRCVRKVQDFSGITFLNRLVVICVVWSGLCTYRCL